MTFFQESVGHVQVYDGLQPFMGRGNFGSSMERMVI